MIDDSDVDFAVLTTPNGGGWVPLLLGLAVVIVLALVAHENRVECEQKRCDRGAPMLTDHECLCVEPAK